MDLFTKRQETILQAIVFAVLGGVVFLFAFGKGPLVIGINADMYHHVGVARQIITAHGLVPLHDGLQFQPAGRTLTYPPLVPMLVAAASGFVQTNVVPVLPWLQILVYLVALASVWLLGKKVFGTGTAFLLTIGMLASGVFFMQYTSLMPAAFMQLWLLLALYALHMRRTWLLVLAITLALYTHISLPFLMLVWLVVCAWREPMWRRMIWKSFLIALVLYIPWLQRVVALVQGFDPLGLWNANPLPGTVFGFASHYALQPIFWLVVAVGLGYALYRWPDFSKRYPQGVAMAVVAALVVHLPFWLLYGGRYFWYMELFCAVFAADVFLVGLLWLGNRHGKHMVWSSTLLVAALLLFVPLPSFLLNYQGVHPARFGYVSSAPYVLIDRIVMRRTGFGALSASSLQTLAPLLVNKPLVFSENTTLALTLSAYFTAPITTGGLWEVAPIVSPVEQVAHATVYVGFDPTLLDTSWQVETIVDTERGLALTIGIRK